MLEKEEDYLNEIREKERKREEEIAEKVNKIIERFLTYKKEFLLPLKRAIRDYKFAGTLSYIFTYLLPVDFWAEEGLVKGVKEPIEGIGSIGGKARKIDHLVEREILAEFPVSSLESAGTFRVKQGVIKQLFVVEPIQAAFDPSGGGGLIEKYKLRKLVKKARIIPMRDDRSYFQGNYVIKMGLWGAESRFRGLQRAIIYPLSKRAWLKREGDFSQIDLEKEED